MKQPDEAYLTLINEAMKEAVLKMTLPTAVKVVIAVLQEIYPDSDFETLYETILFRTNPSLSFPKSDLESILFIEEEARIRVEITVNFLGIFGSGSPLPLHYGEAVYADAMDKRVLSDFLDMLNHRLKRLVFPIWQRQRLYVQHRADLSDRFSKYLLSLVGLYPQSRFGSQSLDLKRILPYVSLLGMHHLNASSLLTILRHYFRHEAIFIEEGIVSQADFPEEQRAKLGEANCTLNEDLCIGGFALTRSLKFRLIFADVPWQMVEGLSPGKEKREALSQLLRLALRVPFDYELQIRIAKEEIEPCRLGANGRLGVNGWIGNVQSDAVVSV